MDRLDSNIYYGYKEALRKTIKNISEDNLKWAQLPLVFVDYWNWEVLYFETKYDAQEYIEKNHTEWDDSPPEGEDEELILFKFCTEDDKEQFPSLYSNYKFFKEINDKKIYKEKSFVEFEPELVINVII